MELLSNSISTPKKFNNIHHQTLSSVENNLDNKTEVSTFTPTFTNKPYFSLDSPRSSSSNADRFIPNRSEINFDYCNRILVSEQDENIIQPLNESKTPSQLVYNHQIQNIMKSTPGKRLLNCFDNSVVLTGQKQHQQQNIKVYINIEFLLLQIKLFQLFLYLF